MAFVTTPFGKVIEETERVALDYYNREEGYEVSDTDPRAATPSGPAKSGPTAVTPPPPPATAPSS